MSEERGYSGAGVALAFILGGVLGGCLALLFAPESGRRTRERLRDLAARDPRLRPLPFTDRPEVEERVLSKARDGSVILMHCGSSATAQALNSILERLVSAGYRPVTVGELITDD